MQGIEMNLEEQSCIFQINELLYPKYVIMKAAYMFIENYYIYFDYEKPEVIKVKLTAKQKLTKEEIEHQVGEFHNELLHQSLRLEIFNKTKNIRELILGRALYSTCVEIDDELKNTDTVDNFEELGILDKNTEESYNEDSQNIAVSWFNCNLNGEKK